MCQHFANTPRHETGKNEQDPEGDSRKRHGQVYRHVRPYYDGRILWPVSDYSNGSRRLREFSDHGHALAEAERIARGLATGEAIAAGIRNSEAASYGRAMELLRPSGASLEIACATYAKGFRHPRRRCHDRGGAVLCR